MKLQPNYSKEDNVSKEGEQSTPVRFLLQWAYFWGCLLFPACIVVQVFLAGLAILVSGSFIELHKTFGYLIIWFPIILLLLGISARLSRLLNWLTALLAALALLQPVLIKIPATIGLPVLSALHPVNALVIFTLPLFLSYQLWQFRRH